jgi:hypothetical protein
MKRILSIAFLLIFLFNVVGYYGVYHLARRQLNAALLNRLDAEAYTEKETITLKLPFSIPYSVESQGYQRVNGSFRYSGEVFRLVKQKLEQDTLYIVCIRDHQEERLSTLMADFVKASNDLPTSTNSLKLLSCFTKDYLTASELESIQSSGWAADQVHETRSYGLVKHFLSIESPPPRA